MPYCPAWRNRPAISPDGCYIAAGDNRSGNVFVWELATGTQITQLPPEVPGIDAVAWSPDGKLFATTLHVHGTRLWGTNDWQLLRHLSASSVVAFSPDSRLVATHCDYEVRLWDADSAKLCSVIATGPVAAQRIAFGADGRQLYLCQDDGAIRIWTLTDDGDVATESRTPGVITPVMRTLLGHTARVQGMAIAPDARLLATASFDGTVRLWDLAGSGGAIPVLHCPGVAAALSPNLDRLTTVTSDSHVATWDVASATMLDAEVTKPYDANYGFRLSPDGEFVCAMSEVPGQGDCTTSYVPKRTSSR